MEMTNIALHYLFFIAWRGEKSCTKTEASLPLDFFGGLVV